MRHACPATFLIMFALLADGETVTNETASLPTVVVTASPISQEETVSKSGAERVLVSCAQLAQLNAQVE